ncbi:MAG: threonine ammonia-lyase [Ginsengibacter sp.]
MEKISIPVNLSDIQKAKSLLQKIIQPTLLDYSRQLSERAGIEVYLKCENLNRTGSFKIRGGYNRMAHLTDKEKSNGVVAASAGNHAQGVALAAKLLGIKATIIMPDGASSPKLLATRAYGAHVEQTGQTIDECLLRAKEIQYKTGAVLIHPFDHKDIVAGQGTCGLEILEQCPSVKTILVSSGGGGLLAGITVAVKSLRPDVKVIGVQAEKAAAYPISLKEGKPVSIKNMNTMADGIAVGRPGKVPFKIIQNLADTIATVSENSLSSALLFLLERTKLVVEPAGAAAVAHLLDVPKKHYEGPLVAVLSGGNIDPMLLIRIIRHGMIAAGRYMQLRVRIPDSPGSLAHLLIHLAGLYGNVLEIEHVRTGPRLLVDEVEIILQVETRGFNHQQEILESLKKEGYSLLPDFEKSKQFSGKL